MSCFWTFGLAAGFIFVMLTMIRWFEQTAEAVDNRWWNKIATLVICPFTVWMFESKVTVNRPIAAPRHEPVRGFGGMPKAHVVETPAPPVTNESPGPAASDQPPPGTPKEFLGMPKIPAPRPRAKSGVDPDKLAKLKQKMREQGMLPPEE